MKLLYVVPYVPNLIRVRPYNLIRSLAQAGHEITVLCLHADPEEALGLEALAACGVEVRGVHLPRWRSVLHALGALAGDGPLQAGFSWSPAALEAAKTLLGGQNGGSQAFEAVHVEHLRGARLGLAIRDYLSAQGAPIPVVWDSVDSISHLYGQAVAHSRRMKDRAIARLELGRTRRLEGRLVSAFAHTIVTSAADRDALLQLSGASVEAVSVLPNGVDLEYFAPDPAVVRDPSGLVLSGKMSYHANVAMALRLVREIMPLVWAERPEVQVVIAGKDPPRLVRALAGDPRVTVTGTVADLRPYFRNAALAVAPVPYGAGIQNKLLEAMACGTPVLAASRAAAGLKAAAGEEICVADTGPAFARAILELLGDARLRDRIGSAGRQYVEKHHHWGDVAARLGALYTQIIRETQWTFVN